VAKRKKAQPWDAVFDQVRVRRDPEYFDRGPATEDDLNTAESQLGVSLPASYRAFMTRFGSGRLMGFLWLYSPIAVPDARRRRDSVLVVGTRDERQAWEKSINRFPSLYTHIDTAFLSRSVYFASDEHNYVYFWDPSDVVNREANEYRVFRLDRQSEGHSTSVGSSFQEFVAWTERQVRSSRREDAEPWPPGITFFPSAIRRKKAPLKRDVKLWLSWNNNTARDLALSIRDRGQTDAFPILADALQDAGCTNADLLDSCRTGDPDIDGKWVLQVLLGPSQRDHTKEEDNP
jgi:hypothetical protein